MKRLLPLTWAAGLTLWVLLAALPLQAGDMMIIQGNDGTTGIVYDLGGIKIYQDSHGTRGTVYDFGLVSTYQFTSPGGETRSGTIYNFGAPPPPNNLTPTPILPFDPHGTLMPRMSLAPVAPFPPSSSFGSFGGGSSGRLGR